MWSFPQKSITIILQPQKYFEHRIKIRPFLRGTGGSHFLRGSVLIRHVGNADNGDRFDFKQEKVRNRRKVKKEAAG